MKQARNWSVKTYDGGREVCNTRTRKGRIEYRSRVALMWERQDGLCCICGQWLHLYESTFEHQDGRGMNGGHRDDRIEKDGKPYNGVAHYRCNAEKGSKRASTGS